MDLKSYAKKSRSSASAHSLNPDTLEQQTLEYSKKSESELMTDLMEEVSKGKADGSFSAEQLEEFIGRVSPMLNETQRERLQKLSLQLKNQL